MEKENIRVIQCSDGTERYCIDSNEQLIEINKQDYEKYNIQIIKRYIPSKGEYYYMVTDNGEIVRMLSNTDEDTLLHIYQNNCFRTKQEALLKEELFDFIYSKAHHFTSQDWVEYSCRDKYVIKADFDERELIVDWETTYACSQFYFKDEATAREVADYIGYNNYLKYVLNIY